MSTRHSHSPTQLVPPLSILLLSALAASCGGRDSGAGTDAELQAAKSGLVIATAADADALIPPLVATTAGKQVVDLLFDHLADPASDVVRTDGDGGFRPALARKWKWSADSLSIAFEIDPSARWHDGQAVTASDVKFSLDLYKDPAVASMHARNFVDIDSISVRDERTAVAWWSRRNPEQFFQLVYNLAVLPRHLLETSPRGELLASSFASHPVGSGRYRFGSWDRKRQLVLVADSANYRSRPRFDRVIWSVAPDPNTATMAVLAGEADVLEVLRGDALTRVAAVPALHTIEYGSLDYGYLVFNQRPSRANNVGFGERAMRVALSAAIDRASAVQGALDSLGRPSLGPVTRAEAMVDTTLAPIAFDTLESARLLDSLGWKWNATKTVRQRNGKPLKFSILVPASSGTRKKLAVLLQAQFAKAGANIEIDAVEPGIFASRLRQGDFDAAINAWRNDPSPATLRQSWGSPNGEDVGANFGRYSSRSFDATVDSAIVSFDPSARMALFHRAYRIILADAPAIWLYEPRNIAAVRSRVVPKGMRADAWLAGLSDWEIDLQGATKRVARAN